MTEVQGSIDPYRVLSGLASSGYTPETAICDIVDNSITWRAKHVWVELEKDPDLAAGRANNARRYIIADDGVGMDEAGLHNALALGSKYEYPEESLSVFGLGLKSAAFSQGTRLEVLTRRKDGPLLKAVIDLETIRQRGLYLLDIAEIDIVGTGHSRVDRHFISNATGTVIIVSEIRATNHPSVKSTAEALTVQLGTIYQYFLTNGLRIELNGERITPFDPLFIDKAEASKRGRGGAAQNPLMNKTWDGKTVEWLFEPKEIVLDPECGVNATLEATQLPHPPSFAGEQDGDQQVATRERYRIGAGNYGVYVYRNRRLISWADRFGGLVPQDQDLYSFRARLFLDESADAVMNIDLRKSRVLLSEAARNALDDVLLEPRRLSREGWRIAKRRVNERSGQDSDSTANRLLNEVKLPEELPNDPGDAESERLRNERRQRESRHRRISPEEARLVEQSGRRVIFVPTLEDNVLWERGYDPERGVIVRINQAHRFVREVYDRFRDNPNLTLVLHSLFLALANGESHSVRTITSMSDEALERIFFELRYSVSSMIYKIAVDVLASQLQE